MDTFLFIGTSTGIRTCKRERKAWSLQHRAAIMKEVTSLSASQGAVLAGTRDGILRTDNLGKKWVDSSQGLGIQYVRWLASHPQEAGLVYAGSEPAGIYISRDSGESWIECPDVFELRERGGWSLPYSPAAGCVHGFAFHGQRVYASAEVGGVLRSTDGGMHWIMANGNSSGASQLA